MDNTTGGRLAGKVAIVSGAGSGMGITHVRALAREGAKVFGFAIEPGVASNSVVYGSAGGRVAVNVATVTV